MQLFLVPKKSQKSVKCVPYFGVQIPNKRNFRDLVFPFTLPINKFWLTSLWAHGALWRASSRGRPPGTGAPSTREWPGAPPDPSPHMPSAPGTPFEWAPSDPLNLDEKFVGFFTFICFVRDPILITLFKIEVPRPEFINFLTQNSSFMLFLSLIRTSGSNLFLSSNLIKFKWNL